jgi:hypothetical protein
MIEFGEAERIRGNAVVAYLKIVSESLRRRRRKR